MSVIFGDEKYMGRIEQAMVRADKNGNTAGAMITATEWAEWNNGQEVFLSALQLTRFLDALKSIVNEPNSYIEQIFGDEKYAGRITRLFQHKGLVEVTEWSEWSNASEAVVTSDQAREILAEFGR